MNESSSVVPLPRPQQVVDIVSDGDVVKARAVGREMARDLGFGTADQTRLATAISELARNVIKYAEKGQCIIVDHSDHVERYVRVYVEDHGPGIPDIDKAMSEGYTTARGLGAGLPGTKRLVQEFEIESEPGHTRVTIALRRSR